MSIGNILGADSAGATQGAERRQSDAPGGIDFRAILDAFKEEATKTPAERAREAVLKKHDLSEEDYRNLSEQERKSIDREIAEAVQRTIRRPHGTRDA